MIPHDATLVLSAIVEAGGEIDVAVLDRQVSSRLASPIVHAGKYLLDKNLITESLSLDARSRERRCYKLRNPQKYNLEKISSAMIAKLYSRATDSRNFHAGYQLVVSGAVARSDPVMKFVEKMSPIDRPAFWKAWSKMSEKDQSDYRARVARLTRRSRRN